MLVAGGVVDEDGDGMLSSRSSCLRSDADFDAGGDVGDDWLDSALLDKLIGKLGEQRIVEPRADVGDAALADFAGNGGGLVVEPSVAEAVGEDGFGVGVGDR